ncbi:hypothetical protein P167DRAFT_569022 [Morchella conica CCBAS932]|uniref:Uncharacterized protein n=1 Tax=Morchella conica CCBAS932 TaxID=1392247 RepID=A0A3N4K857_9PEZI|nr:hypothetical protein P167DRAFT_569022 [Morchella conica CCBAS932]
MLYSATTALHGLALISLSTPAVTELDTLPIYGTTMIALFNSPYLVFHSKDFRGAYAGTRAVVYAWLMLMMASSLTSIWNVVQLDEAATVCPQPGSAMEHRRMQRNQPSEQVLLSSFLVRCLADQTLLGWLIPPLMCMMWVIGKARRLGQRRDVRGERGREGERLRAEEGARGGGDHAVHILLPVYELQLPAVQKPAPGHDEAARAYIGGGAGGWRDPHRYEYTCKCHKWILLKGMSYLIPVVSIVCQCWLLYATQRVMLTLPNQEDRDAIGQWGPLAGTGIAVMAALAVRFGDPQPVKVDVKTVAGPSVVQIIPPVV